MSLPGPSLGTDDEMSCYDNQKGVNHWETIDPVRLDPQHLAR